METAQAHRYPACYIRESTADEATDKEGQLIDCRTAATRDGTDATSLVLYDDWNRSGSETAKRPAQDRLMRDIRANKVSVVYARSLDRLMRSTVLMAQFYRLCDEHGTRIVTLREGEMRDDNPSQWIARQSIMTAAEYESRVGKVRAAASIATKRRNGTRIGRVPYGGLPGEDITALIQAFEQAGSFLGACKLLNQNGTPTRHGRDWNIRSLARILRRPEVDAVPATARRGAPAGRATRIFSGILICPTCDDLLTSMPRAGSVGYYCRRAHANKDHARPYVVAETKILPWARAEVARGLGLLHPAFAEVNENLEQRQKLETRRARVIEAFLDGAIEKPQRDRELKAIDEAMTELGETTRSIRFLGITETFDWNAEPGAVNAGLHGLWRSVELGPDLLPVKANWYISPDEREANAGPLEQAFRAIWPPRGEWGEEETDE